MPTAEESPLLGQAGDLASLVAYQAGAVVSRTLVKKPTGTVTLFAFDVGQGLSEHTAPYDAMVLVLDGRADVILSGVPQRVERGAAVVMPANRPHAVHAPERFKMLLVMIRS